MIGHTPDLTITLEDIVKSRTAELENTQHKLIQQNKVAALGNMAATIVHELSQPLTAMNSSIGAIRAKIEKSDYLGALDSANRLEPLNHKMYSVIKLLKSFSYDDKDTRKTLKLDVLIKNTIDSFSDIFTEKDIILTLDVISADYTAYINETKIDLVFSNIIQNAIDATDENKTKKIKIQLHIENNHIIIDIKDNGVGFKDTPIKQMFSPYFTTKEIGKGLGLGLAICYEIIHEHDGDISATTKDNETCFHIEIPTHPTT